MNKKIIASLITVFYLLHASQIHAQYFADSLYKQLDSSIKKQSFVYAEKDSSELGLDVYTYGESTAKKPCIIFIFGGAFVRGTRDGKIYNGYFNSMAQHGFVCVSISYRLGLKGVKHVSVFNTTPLKNAVNMAVDDLYDATNWLINHKDELGIDTGKIIISGSSSGGITAQTAEFSLCNGLPIAQKLPVGFMYAGVISFSGAVLSFEGKLKYKEPPSPVLMFHGTADKIVTYNKIRFFKTGFYGSSAIAKTFKKNNYPFHLYSEIDLGHEVSVLPMLLDQQVIFDFINDYVFDKKQYEIDTSVKDPDIKPMYTMSAKQMFEKLNE
jgi:predicted esterase